MDAPSGGRGGKAAGELVEEGGDRVRCEICGAPSARRLCPDCDRDIQRRAEELTRHMRPRLRSLRRAVAGAKLVRKEARA